MLRTFSSTHRIVLQQPRRTYQAALFTQNHRPISVAPVRPIAPDPDDCCDSGCEHCVNDIYLDLLRDYREKLVEFQRQGNILTKEQLEDLGEDKNDAHSPASSAFDLFEQRIQASTEKNKK